MPRGRIRWGAAVFVAAALCLAPASASAGSPRVAALQAALQAKGLYTVEVDGVPGPMTRAATMRFQRRKRLTVDGVAGPQTIRALGAAAARGSAAAWSMQPNVGWDVAAVQFLLWRNGFSPGAIDGGFGPGTARAVYAYQRATGLAADGMAGPQTIRALRRGRGGHPDSPVRFFRPLPGPMGDGFGHIGGRRHTGIDFPVPAGTRVKAAGRGVVAFAGWNTGGYGNLVVVKHRLGFASWYAHLGRVRVVAGSGRERRDAARVRGLHRPLDRPAPALGGAPVRHPDQPAAVPARRHRRAHSALADPAARSATTAAPAPGC